ncbi:MAG: response regulator [Verrucomicrobiaceae bacterium]|nr:response regulator [Verrucomicrobiaceae bacterium]
MDTLRLRLLLPLWLFGFLPAMGATTLMGRPLDWFWSTSGLLLALGVLLGAYLITGFMLRPAKSIMTGAGSVLRGVPPSNEVAEWLPSDFWKLRCDINMIFTKQRQALNAAEQHATQTAQRLLNAERLLREAFTALQGIFNASEDGVAVVDAQGSIIATNARLDLFLGRPVEEVAGRDGKKLLSAFVDSFADRQTVAAWLEKVTSQLDTTDQSPVLSTSAADGRVLSLRVAPMTTDSGEILGRIWLMKDHSHLHVLERQLRESQKMGTIGQLAGGIAHDFNNLLTTIRGNLTLAELTPASNAGAVRDKLQSASHATQRAADLVKSLLGYSRTGSRSGAGTSSARKSVNLKQLLADVQQLLKHSVDSSVTIQMRAGLDDSQVHADSSQLQQVMLNLCLNARDALPVDGGIIEIAVENVTRAMRGSEARDHVMLVVRDNGHGISEEHRQRIFEPFFTTKHASKGAGLGLATAQDIVREHGGWIEFDSEPGRGSEFRIYLPRTQVVSESALPQISGSDAYAGADTIAAPLGMQTTILVVDDEAPVRSIAANMLGFLGYRVLEAADGQQMLDICLQGREKIDAILLDIYMPLLSGREAFKQLRAASNNTPVVVCSGFIIDPDEFMLLSQGQPPPVDIMLKPYALDCLSKALAKAVGAPGMDSATRTSPPQATTAAMPRLVDMIDDVAAPVRESGRPMLSA